jgi:hypothetical protein
MYKFILLLSISLLIGACQQNAANSEQETPTSESSAQAPQSPQQEIEAPENPPAEATTSAGTPAATTKTTDDIPEDIEIATFQTSKGWGFEIHFGNTRYMHQPLIPARGLQKGFDKQVQAQKVAELAVDKIKAGIMPPPFTETEVDSIIQKYQ